MLRTLLLVATVGTCLLSAGVAQADLVSYWAFDEGSGSSAANSVSGQPAGTLTNMDAADWVAGHDGTGYALDFDGSNDYLVVTPNSTLNALGGVTGSTPNPLTASAWVKTTQTGAWFNCVACKFGGTPMWGLGWMNPNRLGFVVRNTSSGSASPTAPTANWGLDNQWHLLVGVRGGGKVSFYGDGQLMAEATDPGGNASNTANVMMATHNVSQFVKATMDDVALWDQAITPYAIDLMAKGQVTPATAAAATNSILQDNPVAYWRLEERSLGGANLAADFTGKGHTMTYQNGVTRGLARPFVLEIDNRHASLDGTDDHLSLNTSLTSSEFGGTGSYSIELWFNADSLREGDLLAFTDVTGGNHGILVETQADGKIRFLNRVPSGGSGGGDLVSSLLYTAGEWHHLAVVKDGSTMRLYLDGVLDPVTVTDASSITFNMDLAIGRLGKSLSDR
jgi:hypothetical protein